MTKQVRTGRVTEPRHDLEAPRANRVGRPELKREFVQAMVLAFIVLLWMAGFVVLVGMELLSAVAASAPKKGQNSE